VLVHVLEETAHHSGHLDLLRDALVRSAEELSGSGS